MEVSKTLFPNKIIKKRHSVSTFLCLKHIKQLQDLKYFSNQIIRKFQLHLKPWDFFTTVLMKGSISNPYISFWKGKHGWKSFNVQFESPKHLRGTSARFFFFLVSFLCLTGDVRHPVFPLYGEDGQWGMSSVHAPCYRYWYQWDQSLCRVTQLLGRSVAVPKATNLPSSGLPAEGNQPKKKTMGPSWWNEYYSSYAHFSRRPACKVLGFNKIQLGRRFLVVSLLPPLF